MAPGTLFTPAVAGDCAEVRSLLPPGTGPHGFQSRPQDLLALRRARVLVINGLGLEGFLAPLLRSAASPSLTLIDSSRGVSTLASDPEHAREHAPKPAQPEAGGHAHQPAPQAGDRHHHGHQHGAGANPHIWLDPLRAAQQVENIRDGLIAADPACAEGYRRRAAAATAALRSLDAELASQLRPCTADPSWCSTISPLISPSAMASTPSFWWSRRSRLPPPSDLRRVSEVVRRSGLRVLLSPPGEASRVFDTLARDLGVRVAPFSPMEVLSAAEHADSGTYLRLQRANAAALRNDFTP